MWDVSNIRRAQTQRTSRERNTVTCEVLKCPRARHERSRVNVKQVKDDNLLFFLTIDYYYDIDFQRTLHTFILPKKKKKKKKKKKPDGERNEKMRRSANMVFVLESGSVFMGNYTRVRLVRIDKDVFEGKRICDRIIYSVYIMRICFKLTCVATADMLMLFISIEMLMDDAFLFLQRPDLTPDCGFHL
ncbi:hypothetical protein F2P81_000158 [Scophthalmus maximus]|uniref:Uncharacterized protein n=1 Tax=Scophthalmus maximus TaxID=52904 RepID=A0A6A4TMH7_SCOMX|nr:hypothetical protein F2P81_000158 [Scophthalmus maximus]